VNVQAVSALLAALLIMAIGASVLLRDRSARSYVSFATFTFVVSTWHIATFIEMATDSPWWRWVALWPAATIPPTAIAFFRQFLSQPSIGGPHRPPRVTLAWTLLAYAGLIYGAVIYPIHESNWFLLAVRRLRLRRPVPLGLRHVRAVPGGAEARREGPHPLPSRWAASSRPRWR
jgi:hypothetical protein